MNGKKKMIFAFVVVVLLGIFGTFCWKFIKLELLRKDTIETIEAQVVDFRNGDLFFFDFQINSKFMENTEFQDFLVDQVDTMYKNKEYKLLDGFLCEIEQNNLHCPFLLDAVTTGYLQAQTIEEAYDIWHTLFFREYYSSKISLAKESPLISSYLSKNGIKDISLTPGEGYYANEKDDKNYNGDYYTHDDGETVYLYIQEETIYKGDFKCHRVSGDRLNDSDDVTHYNRSEYYFREIEIPFFPEDDAEIIWSGDYLFYFSSYGDLVSFVKI